MTHPCTEGVWESKGRERPKQKTKAPNRVARRQERKKEGRTAKPLKGGGWASDRGHTLLSEPASTDDTLLPVPSLLHGSSQIAFVRSAPAGGGGRGARRSWLRGSGAGLDSQLERSAAALALLAFGCSSACSALWQRCWSVFSFHVSLACLSRLLSLCLARATTKGDRRVGAGIHHTRLAGVVRVIRHLPCFVLHLSAGGTCLAQSGEVTVARRNG